MAIMRENPALLLATLLLERGFALLTLIFAYAMLCAALRRASITVTFASAKPVLAPAGALTIFLKTRACPPRSLMLGLCCAHLNQNRKSLCVRTDKTAL
jgi:hypothetical protein